MKVEVQYGMGFKGSYCYVRCPKCGEIHVVESTDDIIEDTEEQCTECGALLTIVWRTDDEKSE